MAVAKGGPRKVVKAGAATARTRRKSASTAAHVEAQNALYIAPWAIGLLVALVGSLLHLMWGDASWQWLTQAGMILATGIVAYAGWLNTKARSALALGHTLATVILTGVWLVLCSETGLLGLEHVDWAWWRMPMPQHPTADLFIIGYFALCACWNMRQGIHAKDAKDAATAGETMDEWGEAGVPGVRGHLKQKNDYFKEGVLLLPKGETLQHLQSCAKSIESAWDWPQNSLTLLPMGRGFSSRRVKARVMIKDPLEAAVHYTGVDTNPKLTMLDPFKVAMRADGVISTVYVTKPEGTKHFLIQGMTGSGKTEGQKALILDCAYRGAVQIIIDCVSGVQMFGPLASALQWLITDEGEAQAVLKRLADEVIPARMEQLARERKKTWDPQSSLKLLRVHVEEAWSLLDVDQLMAVAVTARKAGVQLVISLQRASHDQLNTTVREQLGTRFCYGLGGQFGTMILDDEVIDAGANPVQWKDEQPGMFYLTRGGLTVAEKATASRSFYDGDGSPAKFKDVAVQIASRISRMDAITAEAFGVLWDNHTSPLEVVARAEAPPPPRRKAATPAPVSVASLPVTNNGHPAQSAAVASSNGAVVVSDSMVVDDGDFDMPNDEFEEEVLQVCLSEDGMYRTVSGDSLPTETIHYTDVDLDPEIVGHIDDVFDERPVDRPALQFGSQDVVKLPREQLAAQLEQRFMDLQAKGARVIHGGMFVDLVLKAGYTRTVTYKFFDGWRESGRIVKLDDGTGWLFVNQ